MILSFCLVWLLTDLDHMEPLLLRPRRRPLQRVVGSLVGHLVVLAVVVAIGGDLAVLEVAHFDCPYSLYFRISEKSEKFRMLC